MTDASPAPAGVSFGPGPRLPWSPAIVGLALFASATPSPLYADYAARWHFSSPMLTVVFAAYALGALTALLLAGRLSDDLGRRPLLAAGLAGLLGAMLLFAFARSVEWLLAARLVQGVATGTILSPPARPSSSSNRAEIPVEPALSTGSALRSGSAPARLSPRYSCRTPRIPGSLHSRCCVLLVVAVGGVAVLPEPMVRAARPSLRPQRPVVPAEVRSAFALASAGVVASWSIAGLYLALAPSLAPILLHTGSHLAGGVCVFALGASAGLGQVAFRSLTPSQATAAWSSGARRRNGAHRRLDPR